jgi:hypothetical protein
VKDGSNVFGDWVAKCQIQTVSNWSLSLKETVKKIVTALNMTCELACCRF